MDPREDTSLIVFFDLETTPPPIRTTIEFGAILVCPRKLLEKFSYSTLVRPADLSVIPSSFEAKGITRENVAKAPTFLEIAHDVYRLLHGKTWAGHNIERFDCARIKENFESIGWNPPQPNGTIDTRRILSETFGKRAGNMKLKSLASYFGHNEQTHRSLPDACMALQVFKDCGAVLFLESTYPEVLENDIWLSPDDVSINSLNASLTPFYCGSPKIQIFHNNVRLKLRCGHMKIRYEPNHVSPLNFVVDAPARLCEVLECCDCQALKLFEKSGSTSNWKNVIKVYAGRETVRLRIRRCKTEICLKKHCGAEEQVRVSDDELAGLFLAGTSIDAVFLVDTHDYEGSAGIGLIAEKLIVHS